MPRKSKRHLWVRDNKPACGIRHAQFGTRDPDEVTCGACRGTVAMADATIKKHGNY